MDIGEEIVRGIAQMKKKPIKLMMSFLKSGWDTWI